MRPSAPLSPAKDNAILVVHYFSASSHCAGKYQESDPVPGFWDGLIGPGKAVDTNKYFVVCSDNLCNCGAKNPTVVATGPMTTDPSTGKPYGLRFPVPEVLDVVNTQKLLLESLGITHLESRHGPLLRGHGLMAVGRGLPGYDGCHHPSSARPACLCGALQSFAVPPSRLPRSTQDSKAATTTISQNSPPTPSVCAWR